MKRILATLVVWALLAAVGAADVVYLKDGRKVEGRIVAEDASQLTVATRFGRQVISRADVARVEKGLTPAQEAERRAEALDPGDADGWFELAEYCAEHRLRKQRERFLRSALAADPEHAGAHRALGHVPHGGRWMTPEERDAAVEAERLRAMREKGLVQYQGRWVTPAEKEQLAQGEVLDEGRWVTETEARTAQGYVRVGDTWIHHTEQEVRRQIEAFAAETGLDLTRNAGDHVVVATVFGEEYSRGLTGKCEQALRLVRETLAEQPGVEWLGQRKVQVIALDRREDFRAFAHFFARNEPKTNERWAEGVGRSDGFYWWDPCCTSATFKGTRYTDDTTAHSIHHMGHLLLNRHGYNFKFLPAWLDEGYAALVELDVLGSNRISCLPAQRYGASNRRERRLLTGDQMMQEVIRDMKRRADPPLDRIVRRDLSTLDQRDVAKSMAVLDYLRKERLEDFRRFLSALREAWPTGRVAAGGPDAWAAHLAAFEVLGTHPVPLDAEVRSYYAEER